MHLHPRQTPQTHPPPTAQRTQGGELFDAIVEQKNYSEKDAAALIRTIVGVVAHCHNMGVMHRDLKPENFLLESKAKDAAILCTDFGLSAFFKPGQQFSEARARCFFIYSINCFLFCLFIDRGAAIL
jgi:serine/threonine protein kinase